MAAFIKFAPIYTVFSILVFFVLRLYRSLWRFAGFSELNHIFVASVITTAFHCVGITILFKRMPISYYMMTDSIMESRPPSIGTPSINRPHLFTLSSITQTGFAVDSAEFFSSLIITCPAAPAPIIQTYANLLLYDGSSDTIWYDYRGAFFLPLYHNAEGKARKRTACTPQRNDYRGGGSKKIFHCHRLHPAKEYLPVCKLEHSWQCAQCR